VNTRVLVADDEPDMRLLVSRLLQREGFDVTMASSGEEALQSYAEDPADAVVLDHRMDGLTGVETAQQLRETGCHAPILIFSAYLEPAIEQLASELGVATLPKADAPRLAAAVRTLLDDDPGDVAHA
jgi:CheY-like chemotaxis protein